MSRKNSHMIAKKKMKKVTNELDRKLSKVKEIPEEQSLAKRTSRRVAQERSLNLQAPTQRKRVAQNPEMPSSIRDSFRMSGSRAGELPGLNSPMLGQPHYGRNTSHFMQPKMSRDPSFQRGFSLGTPAIP